MNVKKTAIEINSACSVCLCECALSVCSTHTKAQVTLKVFLASMRTWTDLNFITDLL